MSAFTHQKLFGHQAVSQQLKNAFDQGKLHHALIFSGTEGIGKETLAYHLIRYALAFPQGNLKQSNLIIPDDHRVMKQIEAGSQPNLLVITPVYDEKKQRFARDITLEALERLQDFMRLAPVDDASRFVLIHPAESMNRFTQNAILKILEEPPAKTYFILLTSQIGSLLPTIRSRALTVTMDALSQDDFEAGLEYFQPGLSGKKMEALYNLSQGALGKALTFEENEILDTYGDFCRAALAWQDNDSQPAMQFAEANAQDGPQLETLYQLWLLRLSQVLKAQLAQKALEPLIPEEQRLLDVWRDIDPQILLAGYDRLQTLWMEGENAYLDKKLILLKALGLLSGMDMPKRAVLA